ncbi:MAG: sulfatase-like hydrolase/transferase [Bacilli bacterium]|nr:sulfatase-like hydrolase/transferase [Bacilli bacterium]
MKEKVKGINFNKIKNRIVRYFKHNILFIVFVLTSVGNSSLLRFLTLKNYFEIKPVLADTAVVIIIGAFSYFLKPKKRFAYYMIFGCIFTFLCIVNSMYYTNYLSFASVSLLSTSLQVIDVGDAVVKNVMEIKDFSYLWQVFALIFAYKALKKKKKIVNAHEVKKVKVIHTLIAGLVFLGMFISTLTSLDIGRLSKQWNREYIVMKFGLYTYQLNDIVSSIKPQISGMFGYDEHAKTFREYYEKNYKEPEQNKYTNIFEGKNLLVIHAESVQNFTLNTSFNGVDVAPTLKRLANEGLYFSNFYAQESVGTSSDSEFTFNSSLLPASSGTVSINYWDREYVTIPKLLGEKGYYAFSMHGNNGTFWNRANFHSSYGYKKFYNYKTDFNIDETIGLGLSDKSFFKQAVPKIKDITEKNQNYYGTLIMLTNHTPWSDIDDFSDYAVDYKYEETDDEGNTVQKSAPYMEDTILGRYFKSVHYADEAIDQLINDLDKEGLLDNTVIAIYGDHDAKIKKSEYLRYYNYDYLTDSVKDSDDPTYVDMDYYDYELNRKVPFIIWSKDIEHEEVSKVMGMYDVLPTLGNMFGFNSKYALGHDIFSIDENVVIFPGANWLTDKMYYNQQKSEGKLLDSNETVSVDYIEKYCKLAEEELSISNSIEVYDLIRKTKESQSVIEGGY